MKSFFKFLAVPAFCLYLFYFLIQYALPIQIKEQSYTQFDPQIGWVSRPNFKDENFYGPGKKFSTNPQGFRGEQNYSAKTPAGKLRIICSGDSYTLGYGVSNEETWCSRLESQIPGAETVNMGQGGYGIDQSYLWYLRAGAGLEHQIHLFAFISDDFYRMRRDNLMEIYPKPLLEVKNGVPLAVNTPLRRPVFTHLRMTFKSALLKLSLLKQTRVLGPTDTIPLEKNTDIGSLFFSIAQELQKQAESTKSLLVLVYLPDPADLFEGTTAGFRRRLAAQCAEKGLHFLDLTPAFNTASPKEMESFFDEQTGHYSVQGNLRAAKSIEEFLLPLLNSRRRTV